MMYLHLAALPLIWSLTATEAITSETHVPIGWLIGGIAATVGIVWKAAIDHINVKNSIADLKAQVSDLTQNGYCHHRREERLRQEAEESKEQ